MHEIKASSYEYDRSSDILNMKFEVDDLIINNGNMVYVLMKGFPIKYVVDKKEVHNSNDIVLMRTNYGTTVSYYVYQLFNFRGFKDAFREYVQKLMKKETSLDVSEATNKLMDEIMTFHKETVIDQYLATGNKEAFMDLMNT